MRLWAGGDQEVEVESVRGFGDGTKAAKDNETKD